MYHFNYICVYEHVGILLLLWTSLRKHLGQLSDHVSDSLVLFHIASAAPNLHAEKDGLHASTAPHV